MQDNAELRIGCEEGQLVVTRQWVRVESETPAAAWNLLRAAIAEATHEPEDDAANALHTLTLRTRTSERQVHGVAARDAETVAAALQRSGIESTAELMAAPTITRATMPPAPPALPIAARLGPLNEAVNASWAHPSQSDAEPDWSEDDEITIKRRKLGLATRVAILLHRLPHPKTSGGRRRVAALGLLGAVALLIVCFAVVVANLSTASEATVSVPVGPNHAVTRLATATVAQSSSTSAATAAPTVAPTVVPTVVPTATVSALAPVPLTFTCASAINHTQARVCVHTQPGAALTISVKYCGGFGAADASPTLQGAAHADARGDYSWNWVPSTSCGGGATVYVTAEADGHHGYYSYEVPITA